MVPRVSITSDHPRCRSDSDAFAIAWEILSGEVPTISTTL
jgi:hypothetical protein